MYVCLVNMKPARRWPQRESVILPPAGALHLAPMPRLTHDTGMENEDVARLAISQSVRFGRSVKPELSSPNASVDRNIFRPIANLPAGASHE